MVWKTLSKIGKFLKKNRKAGRRIAKTRSGGMNAGIRNQVSKFKGGGNSGYDTIFSLNRVRFDPFPNELWVKLVYVDNFAFVAPASNVAAETVFALNSIFDPEQSGVGHQPYGRDQLAPLYLNYIVTSAIVSIEFYDTDQDGAFVGYQIQGDTTTGGTISALSEHPWSRSTSMANTGQQKNTFRMNIKNSAAVGLRSRQYYDDTDNNGATMGADPNNLALLRIWVLSTIPATITNIKAKLTITYNTKCFNRKSLGQS